MRAYVVHPGVDFSTADVYTGLCAGLRANGVEVIEGRLDTAMRFQAALYEAGQREGIVTPGHINISYYASPYIAQEAILKEPDVVIVVSAHNFNVTSARALRRAGLRLVMLATESPYFDSFEPAMASYYDVVFTNERLCGKDYFHHSNVHYLPHAYHPAIHTLEGPKAEPHDVVFIGSIFDERAALFGQGWPGIDFHLRGYRLDTGAMDLVDNFDAAALYRSAKVNLNHHRTTMTHGSGVHIPDGFAESLNPRAYEISACGGFQLMDDTRAERFAVFGDTVPAYKAGDSQDLERQVRYWLGHPDRREATARAMYEAVLPHSWVNRAQRVLEVAL